MKIFDAIQAKIKRVLIRGSDGNMYHVPVDDAKGHYFIGK